MLTNETPMIIENAVLEEITKDGSQKYRYGPAVTDVMWLTGMERAKNVEVGNRGRLVYQTGPGYGLYFFEKEDTPEKAIDPATSNDPSG